VGNIRILGYNVTIYRGTWHHCSGHYSGTAIETTYVVDFFRHRYSGLLTLTLQKYLQRGYRNSHHYHGSPRTAVNPQ